MKGSIGEYIRQLHMKRLQHRRMLAWTTVLALLVVSSIVWGLRVKGISLTNDVDCGLEEHIHDGKCYQIFQICGMEDGDIDSNGEIHIHSEDCFESELACCVTEHVHTVECIELENEIDTASEDEIIQAAEIEEIIASMEAAAEQEELIDYDESMISEEYISEPALYATGGNAMADGPDIEELIRRKLLDTEDPIKYGEFYVVTATGLRHADEIHEYLVDANGVPRDEFMNIIEKDGKQYKYLKNNGIDHGRTIPESEWSGKGYASEADYRQAYDSFRYLLHEDYPLHLVVFRNEAQTSTDFGEYTGCWFYTGEHAGVKSTTTYTHSNMTEIPDGRSVIVGDINPGAVGEHGVIHFDSMNSTDRIKSFFTYVRSSRDTYMHSDIEITDGGFFKIDTTKNLQDGSSQTITTDYQSFVSMVKECKVYYKDNPSVPFLTFPEYCYQKIDDDGTQYELTSQYYCAAAGGFNFDISKVDHVDFVIELSLAPKESRIVKRDTNGVIISDDTKDFRKSDGSFDYTVTPLTVTMGKQSIIDAMNKCPANSGMDFNLLYSEINLNLTEPTVAQMEVYKKLEGDGLEYKQFKFELLDSDGKRVGEIVEPVEDGALGKVTFPEMDYPIPGTYKYKIREIIPDGAICVEPDVYYKDFVRYDGRVIDVEVIVELTESLVAIVQGTNDKKPDLRATVKYSINGEEIDYNSVEDKTFTNTSVDYEETNLRVNKVWKGGSEHPDHITFRVRRTKNGIQESFYAFEGNTVFELNDDNSWQMEFLHLPVIVGTDAYTYKIEETSITGYSPGYKRVDSGGYTNWTITNVLNEDRELHFKKVWKDDDGNEIDGPVEPLDDPDQEVHIKLHRLYQEQEILVKVKIQSTDGGTDFSDEFDVYGYKGGTASFKLESLPGVAVNVGTITADNCNCYCDTTNGNTYNITDIDNGAEVIIRYNPVRESEMLLWHTHGNDLQQFADTSLWTFEDGHGSACYSTYHSHSGDGTQAWQIRSRVRPDASAQLDLDLNRFRPGGYYSFSSYVRYNNTFSYVLDDVEHHDTVYYGQIPDDLKLKMILVTNGTGGERRLEIASTGEKTASDTFHPLLNNMVQIPAGTTSAKLLITSSARTRSESTYVDVFYDDVIIAPGGIDTGTSTSGNLEAVRRYKMVNYTRSVPTEVINDVWREDEAGEIKGFALSKDIAWKKGFKISQLGGSVEGVPELPNRRYRYYVVEQPVPDKYQVTYINNDVENNSEDNPIIIENKYCAYELPHTGGIGSYRIRWLGLLILLAGLPPTLCSLVRKRGRPSG